MIYSSSLLIIEGMIDSDSDSSLLFIPNSFIAWCLLRFAHV